MCWDSKVNILPEMVLSRPQALKLGVFRAKSCSICENFNLVIHGFSNEFYGVSDRYLEIAVKVNHFTQTLIRIQHGDETSYSVLHIVEIASWRNRTPFNLPPVTGDLGDYGWNNGTGRLARTIDIKGPRNNYR